MALEADGSSDKLRSVQSLEIDHGYQKNSDIYFKNTRMKRVPIAPQISKTFLQRSPATHPTGGDDPVCYATWYFGAFPGPGNCANQK
jgi:hypothetical protein